MKKIILLAFVLVLASCVTPADRKAQKETYIAQYKPSAEVAGNIRAGFIQNGMTKDEVIASIGQPCSYCYGTLESSSGDTWEYNTFGTAAIGIGRGKYIFFNNKDKVIGWLK